MRGSGADFTPPDWPTVVPRIVAKDAPQLVEFITHVFGATGEYQPDRLAVLSIGGSMIMISDAGVRDPASAFLYVYVADTDVAPERSESFVAAAFTTGAIHCTVSKRYEIAHDYADGAIGFRLVFSAWIQHGSGRT